MRSSHFPRTPLAACALITLALAACGGKPDDYAGKPGETPASDAPAAPDAAPARAIVPDGGQFALDDQGAEAVLALKVGATCSLENLVSMTDGQPSPGPAANTYLAKRGNAYTLVGFATNAESGTVPATVRVLLLGAEVYGVDARTGFARPDVAEYFKVPAFATAGYQAVAGFDDVAPGEYRVFVLEADGPAPVACPSHQSVIVQ